MTIHRILTLLALVLSIALLASGALTPTISPIADHLVGSTYTIDVTVEDDASGSGAVLAVVLYNSGDVVTEVSSGGQGIAFTTQPSVACGPGHTFANEGYFYHKNTALTLSFPPGVENTPCSVVEVSLPHDFVDSGAGRVIVTLTVTSVKSGQTNVAAVAMYPFITDADNTIVTNDVNSYFLVDPIWTGAIRSVGLDYEVSYDFSGTFLNRALMADLCVLDGQAENTITINVAVAATAPSKAVNINVALTNDATTTGAALTITSVTGAASTGIPDQYTFNTVPGAGNVITITYSTAELNNLSVNCLPVGVLSLDLDGANAVGFDILSCAAILEITSISLESANPGDEFAVAAHVAWAANVEDGLVANIRVISDVDAGVEPNVLVVDPSDDTTLLHPTENSAIDSFQQAIRVSGNPTTSYTFLGRVIVPDGSQQPQNTAFSVNALASGDVAVIPAFEMEFRNFVTFSVGQISVPIVTPTIGIVEKTCGGNLIGGNCALVDGQQVTYTVTVSKLALLDSVATTFEVKVSYPVGLSFVSFTEVPGVYTASTNSDLSASREFTATLTVPTAVDSVTSSYVFDIVFSYNGDYPFYSDALTTPYAFIASTTPVGSNLDTSMLTALPANLLDNSRVGSLSMTVEWGPQWYGGSVFPSASTTIDWSAARANAGCANVYNTLLAVGSGDLALTDVHQGRFVPVFIRLSNALGSFENTMYNVVLQLDLPVYGTDDFEYSIYSLGLIDQEACMYLDGETTFISTQSIQVDAATSRVTIEQIHPGDYTLIVFLRTNQLVVAATTSISASVVSAYNVLDGSVDIFAETLAADVLSNPITAEAGQHSVSCEERATSDQLTSVNKFTDGEYFEYDCFVKAIPGLHDKISVRIDISNPLRCRFDPVVGKQHFTAGTIKTTAGLDTALGGDAAGVTAPNPPSPTVVSGVEIVISLESFVIPYGGATGGDAFVAYPYNGGTNKDAPLVIHPAFHANFDTAIQAATCGAQIRDSNDAVISTFTLNFEGVVPEVAWISNTVPATSVSADQLRFPLAGNPFTFTISSQDIVTSKAPWHEARIYVRANDNSTGLPLYDVAGTPTCTGGFNHDGTCMINGAAALPGTSTVVYSAETIALIAEGMVGLFDYNGTTYTPTDAMRTFSVTIPENAFEFNDAIIPGSDFKMIWGFGAYETEQNHNVPTLNPDFLPPQAEPLYRNDPFRYFDLPEQTVLTFNDNYVEENFYADANHIQVVGNSNATVDPTQCVVGETCDVTVYVAYHFGTSNNVEITLTNPDGIDTPYEFIDMYYADSAVFFSVVDSSVDLTVNGQITIRHSQVINSRAGSGDLTDRLAVIEDLSNAAPFIAAYTVTVKVMEPATPSWSIYMKHDDEVYGVIPTILFASDKIYTPAEADVVQSTSNCPTEGIIGENFFCTFRIENVDGGTVPPEASIFDVSMQFLLPAGISFNTSTTELGAGTVGTGYDISYRQANGFNYVDIIDESTALSRPIAPGEAFEFVAHFKVDEYGGNFAQPGSTGFSIEYVAIWRTVESSVSAGAEANRPVDVIANTTILDFSYVGPLFQYDDDSLVDLDALNSGYPLPVNEISPGQTVLISVEIKVTQNSLTAVDYIIELDYNETHFLTVVDADVVVDATATSTGLTATKTVSLAGSRWSFQVAANTVVDGVDPALLVVTIPIVALQTVGTSVDNINYHVTVERSATDTVYRHLGPVILPGDVNPDLLYGKYFKAYIPTFTFARSFPSSSLSSVQGGVLINLRYRISPAVSTYRSTGYAVRITDLLASAAVTRDTVTYPALQVVGGTFTVTSSIGGVETDITLDTTRVSVTVGAADDDITFDATLASVDPDETVTIDVTLEVTKEVRPNGISYVVEQPSVVFSSFVPTIEHSEVVVYAPGPFDSTKSLVTRSTISPSFSILSTTEPSSPNTGQNFNALPGEGVVLAFDVRVFYGISELEFTLTSTDTAVYPLVNITVSYLTVPDQYSGLIITPDGPGTPISVTGEVTPISFGDVQSIAYTNADSTHENAETLRILISFSVPTDAVALDSYRLEMSGTIEGISMGLFIINGAVIGGLQQGASPTNGCTYVSGDGFNSAKATDLFDCEFLVEHSPTSRSGAINLEFEDDLGELVDPNVLSSAAVRVISASCEVDGLAGNCEVVTGSAAVGRLIIKLSSLDYTAPDDSQSVLFKYQLEVSDYLLIGSQRTSNIRLDYEIVSVQDPSQSEPAFLTFDPWTITGGHSSAQFTTSTANVVGGTSGNLTPYVVAIGEIASLDIDYTPFAGTSDIQYDVDVPNELDPSVTTDSTVVSFSLISHGDLLLGNTDVSGLSYSSSQFRNDDPAAVVEFSSNLIFSAAKFTSNLNVAITADFAPNVIGEGSLQAIDFLLGTPQLDGTLDCGDWPLTNGRVVAGAQITCTVVVQSTSPSPQHQVSAHNVQLNVNRGIKLASANYIDYVPNSVTTSVGTISGSVVTVNELAIDEVLTVTYRVELLPEAIVPNAVVSAPAVSTLQLSYYSAPVVAPVTISDVVVVTDRVLTRPNAVETANVETLVVSWTSPEADPTAFSAPIGRPVELYATFSLIHGQNPIDITATTTIPSNSGDLVLEYARIDTATSDAAATIVSNVEGPSGAAQRKLVVNAAAEAGLQVTVVFKATYISSADNIALYTAVDGGVVAASNTVSLVFPADAVAPASLPASISGTIGFAFVTYSQSCEPAVFPAGSEGGSVAECTISIQHEGAGKSTFDAEGVDVLHTFDPQFEYLRSSGDLIATVDITDGSGRGGFEITPFVLPLGSILNITYEFRIDSYGVSTNDVVSLPPTGIFADFAVPNSETGLLTVRRNIPGTVAPTQSYTIVHASDTMVFVVSPQSLAENPTSTLTVAQTSVGQDFTFRMTIRPTKATDYLQVGFRRESVTGETAIISLLRADIVSAGSAIVPTIASSTTNAVGGTVIIDLGSVTNVKYDAALVETIIIDLTIFIETESQDGDTFTIGAYLSYDDTLTPFENSDANGDVLEALVTGVTNRQLLEFTSFTATANTAAQAGDEITLSLTLEHSDLSNFAAYQVSIIDAFNRSLIPDVNGIHYPYTIKTGATAVLTDELGSVVDFSDPAFGGLISSDSNNLDVYLETFPLDYVLQITYTVILTPELVAGDSPFFNNPALTYCSDSAPGCGIASSQGTGISATPKVVAATPSSTFALVGSNLADFSDLTAVVLGEQITYSITTTPIVGTNPLTVSMKVTGASSFAFSDASGPVDSVITESGGAVTFEVNYVSDTNDVVTFNVTVTLSSVASAILYTVSPTDNYASFDGSQALTANIVRPNVTITLDEVSPSTDVDAHDIVTFTLSLTNVFSRAVYDIRLLHTLTAGGVAVPELVYGNDIDNVGLGIGTDNFNAASPNTVDYVIDVIAGNGDDTITFTASVTNVVTPGDSFSVDAGALSYNSVPASSGTPAVQSDTFGAASFTVPDATYSLALDVSATGLATCSASGASTCEIPIGADVAVTWTFTLIEGTSTARFTITGGPETSFKSITVTNDSGANYTVVSNTVAAQTVTLDAGAILLDSDVGGNVFSVTAIATVLDTTANVAGDLLSFAGSVTYDVGSFSATLADVASIIEPTLVPDLALVAAGVGNDATFGAYQDLDVTFTIDNTGGVDAHGISVSVDYAYSVVEIVGTDASAVTVTIASTAATTSNFVDYGDGFSVDVESILGGAETLVVSFTLRVYTDGYFYLNEGVFDVSGSVSYNSFSSLEARSYVNVATPAILGTADGADAFAAEVVLTTSETATPEFVDASTTVLLIVGERVNFDYVFTVPHGTTDLPLTLTVDNDSAENFRIGTLGTNTRRSSPFFSSLVNSDASGLLASPDDLIANSSFVIDFGRVTNNNVSPLLDVTDTIRVSWSLVVFPPLVPRQNFTVDVEIQLGASTITTTYLFEVIRPVVEVVRTSATSNTIVGGDVVTTTFVIRHSDESSFDATNLTVTLDLTTASESLVSSFVLGTNTTDPRLVEDPAVPGLFVFFDPLFVLGDELEVVFVSTIIPAVTGQVAQPTPGAALNMEVYFTYLIGDDDSARITSPASIVSIGSIRPLFNGCNNDNGSCQQSCVFLPPYEFECQCFVGYSFDASQVCVDDDECSDATNCAGTGEVCVNTPGSFACECDTGYVRTTSNTCVLPDALCGNGVLDTDEECETGLGCEACLCAAGYSADPEGGLSCIFDTVAPTCGDGVLNQASEECDGGLGCDSSCLCIVSTSNNSLSYTPKNSIDCEPVIVPGTCGDGVLNVAGGELCDPPGQGCSVSCICETGFSADGRGGCRSNNPCGNGRIDPGEECEGGAANGCNECLCLRDQGYAPNSPATPSCKLVATPPPLPCATGLYLDRCQQCHPLGDPSFDSCVGCDDVPNSGYTLDTCGICRGPTDPNRDSCTQCDTGKYLDQCGQCLIPSYDADKWDSCIGCDNTANSGAYLNSCGDCSVTPLPCGPVGCDGSFESAWVLDSCDNCRDPSDPEFATDATACPESPRHNVYPNLYCWDFAPSATVQNYIAFAGFENIGEAVTIPVGTDAGNENAFSIVTDRGQPVYFPKGRNSFPAGITAWVWNGDEETWTVQSRVLTVDIPDDREFWAEYQCPAEFSIAFAVKGPAGANTDADAILALREAFAEAAGVAVERVSIHLTPSGVTNSDGTVTYRVDLIVGPSGVRTEQDAYDETNIDADPPVFFSPTLPEPDVSAAQAIHRVVSDAGLRNKVLAAGGLEFVPAAGETTTNVLPYDPPRPRTAASGVVASVLLIVAACLAVLL